MRNWQRAFLLAATAFTVIRSTPSWAAAESKAVTSGGQTAVTTTNLPDSDLNYLDDGLLWNHNILARSDPAGEDVYCIPARTRLMGIKPTLDTVTKTSGGATQTEQYLQVILDPRPRILGLFGKVQQKLDATSSSPCRALRNSLELDISDVAYVSNKDLGMAAYRGGFDYGALAIPFKVQMTGKRSFSGSSSIGAYLGYRIPWVDSGVEFRPIIFAGAANISTSATTAGTTSSQTVAGLSYGLGLISTIKGSFQVGLVLGFDHVDSAQPYVYNDKPWLSVEIGYSFAN
jgi:hypothetical protein